jgi:hypothetical protein
MRGSLGGRATAASAQGRRLASRPQFEDYLRASYVPKAHMNRHDLPDVSAAVSALQLEYEPREQ